MSISNYAANTHLNFDLGATSYSAPATWYVGLSTVSVTATGSYTEPVSGSYARVAVTNNKTNFSTSTGSTLTNLTAITFPESSGSWGTITDIMYLDASASGNLWYYQALPTPKIVQSETTVSFSASTINITIANI
jgi:hypothetical protein